MICLFAFFPHITDPLANLFGMGRGLDFILIFGLSLSFYLIIKLYIKVDNMNQQMSELVRRLAVEKEKNDYKERSEKLGFDFDYSDL